MRWALLQLRRRPWLVAALLVAAAPLVTLLLLLRGQYETIQRQQAQIDRQQEQIQMVVNVQAAICEWFSGTGQVSPGRDVAAILDCGPTPQGGAD